MSITLSQIKKALKIDYTTDDQELLRLRDAAISWITTYTGIALETTTKVQYLSYWMRTSINTLPFNSITSVKYYYNDVLTTMPSTSYWIDRSQDPSIYINFLDYPSLDEGTQIQLTYSVGYADYPKEIEQVVIALVGSWYNNPEATAPIALQTVPMSAQFILENLRVKNGVLS
jgi:hypothetical protein